MNQLKTLEYQIQRQKHISTPSKATIPLDAENNYHHIQDIKKRNDKYRKRIDLNLNQFEDTTVLHILSKNHDWDKAAFVCDLTASMSPYVVQVLAWFRAHMEENKVHSFTFFNDGNKTADYKKRLEKQVEYILTQPLT